MLLIWTIVSTTLAYKKLNPSLLCFTVEHIEWGDYPDFLELLLGTQIMQFAAIFSCSLFLASRPPLHTAGCLKCTPPIGLFPPKIRLIINGQLSLWGQPAVLSDHCSTAFLLLTPKVGTALQSFLTLISLHPLLLEYFGDRWRGDSVLPAKLSGCYANLVACGLCPPLPRSPRQPYWRLVVHSQQLSQCSQSSPWPLECENGPSWDPHCHKVSNGVWLPLSMISW